MNSNIVGHTKLSTVPSYEGMAIETPVASTQEGEKESIY